MGCQPLRFKTLYSFISGLILGGVFVFVGLTLLGDKPTAKFRLDEPGAEYRIVTIDNVYYVNMRRGNESPVVYIVSSAVDLDEYFAKLIGRVDTESVKRDPKTDTQHELFSPLAEQWEQWIDRLRFQPPRRVMVAGQDGRVASIRTITIPSYTATEAQVEEARRESAARHGIAYAEAERNVQETLVAYEQGVSIGQEIPAHEMLAV